MSEKEHEDLLSAEESLFTAPGILEIDYLPRLMPYREDQQKYLARVISRLPSLGTNVLITGPPGIGKTACVRWVFRELRESGESDATPLYINCWQDNSAEKIGIRLAGQFGINTAYRKADEILSLVLQKIKTLKAVVLAFDEVDKLERESFLYNFTEELPHKSIFLISTKKDWLARIDERVRSRLMPELMEFDTYSKEQTQGILAERRDHSFVPGVWNPVAFDRVVERCYASRDIRTGLALLKNSGLIAEHEGVRKIRQDHVEAAVRKLNMKAGPPGEGKKITDFKEG
jgi:cell division control protein 6